MTKNLHRDYRRKEDEKDNYSHIYTTYTYIFTYILYNQPYYHYMYLYVHNLFTSFYHLLQLVSSLTYIMFPKFRPIPARETTFI
jgi:hypothetical protein